MTESGSESGDIELRYRLLRESFSLDIAQCLPMRGITGIFGPSGSGKTSLLRCIAGLEVAEDAFLRVDSATWDDSARSFCLPTHQRALGYVFQEPRLFPHLDVRSNLHYGRRRARHAAAADFDDVVALLGLDSLLGRSPSDLSGGESQRVAIGRAVLSAPRIILMDEPLAALDAGRRHEVLPFIERLHAHFDIPVLYVSHSIDEICQLCDQLLVLEDGRVLANGDLQSVLARTDLPMLGGAEAGAVLNAVVADYDAAYDLSRLEFSGGSLLAPGRYEKAQVVRVRVRANDVSVSLDEDSRSSILNRLKADITAITADAPSTALLKLRAGDAELMSRITRRSLERLGLQAGDSVIAQLKSVSVRQAGD
mgnify:CR=1 FL=1